MYTKELDILNKEQKIVKKDYKLKQEITIRSI